MAASIVGPIQGASPGLPGGVYRPPTRSSPRRRCLVAAPGIAVTLVCVAPGSAGSLTLNDCTTTGAAAATNEIFSRLFSAFAAGQVIPLRWPCASGICISAAPTGGQFSLAFFRSVCTPL